MISKKTVEKVEPVVKTVVQVAPKPKAEVKPVVQELTLEEFAKRIRAVWHEASKENHHPDLHALYGSEHCAFCDKTLKSIPELFEEAKALKGKSADKKA